MSEEFHSILVSLLAGLQTVFSPCLFPVLPAYLIFLARRVKSSLKVTLAFVASLSASLLAYAIVVANIGRTLLLTLSLTPDAVSFALATIFACLAVIEVLPARHMFSAVMYRSLEVRGATVASSAMLGALFALAAAPCASAPLLAWTTILLLHPSSMLLSLAAFLTGVAVPFIIIGALAQGMGQRLHRALAKSLVVKRSYEISAALFAAFALIVLSSSSDPLSIITRYSQQLDVPARFLLSLALLSAGISLFTLVPKATRGVLLSVASLPTLGGIAGAVISLLHPFSREGCSIFACFLGYLSIVSSALTAVLWSIVSAKEGGRAGKWMAANASALTLCMFFDYVPHFTLFHPWVTLFRYVLYIISVGTALSLLTILAQARALSVHSS